MDHQLYDINWAAKYLGTTKGTLYVWVSKGFVPYVKLGRKTMFDKAKLDPWIESKSVEGKGFNSAQKYNKIVE